MKLVVMLSYLLDLVRSFEPVLDAASGSDRTTGLRKIVDDWINPDTRSSVESTYGPIANWDTSGATDMSYLFYPKRSFNANISEWNVANVANMRSSPFQFFFFFSTMISPLFLCSKLV